MKQLCSATINTILLHMLADPREFCATPHKLNMILFLLTAHSLAKFRINLTEDEWYQTTAGPVHKGLYGWYRPSQDCDVTQLIGTYLEKGVYKQLDQKNQPWKPELTRLTSLNSFQLASEYPTILIENCCEVGDFREDCWISEDILRELSCKTRGES